PLSPPNTTSGQSFCFASSLSTAVDLRCRDLRTLHPGFAYPRHSRRTRTWLAASDQEGIDQAPGRGYDQILETCFAFCCHIGPRVVRARSDGMAFDNRRNVVTTPARRCGP